MEQHQIHPNPLEREPLSCCQHNIVNSVMILLLSLLALGAAAEPFSLTPKDITVLQSRLRPGVSISYKRVGGFSRTSYGVAT